MKTEKPASAHPRSPLCFLLLALLAWASAFVVTRAAVRSISPGALACGRYLTASIVFVLIAIRIRPALPAQSDWWRLALAGVSGIGIYNLTFNAGISTVPAGTASLVLNGIIPLGTALGSMTLMKERIAGRWWLASACSLAGLIAIAWGRDGRIGGAGIPWLILTGFSAIALNLGQKSVLARLSALSVTTWVIWLGTLPLLFWAPQLVRDLTAHPHALWQVIYLGVLPGALAYLFWAVALKFFPAGKTSMTLFTIPAQVTLLAWLFLGELPAPLSLAGGVLIIGSVAWAAWPRQSPDRR